jgi:hypothetical protein
MRSPQDGVLARTAEQTLGVWHNLLPPKGYKGQYSDDEKAVARNTCRTLGRAFVVYMTHIRPNYILNARQIIFHNLQLLIYETFSY